MSFYARSAMFNGITLIDISGHKLQSGVTEVDKTVPEARTLPAKAQLTKPLSEKQRKKLGLQPIAKQETAADEQKQAVQPPAAANEADKAKGTKKVLYYLGASRKRQP